MNIDNGLHNYNCNYCLNSSLVWLLALLCCLDKQMQCILQVMVGILMKTQKYSNKSQIKGKK